MLAARGSPGLIRINMKTLVVIVIALVAVLVVGALLHFLMRYLPLD